MADDGRFNRARFVAFRQDDPLVGFAGALHQHVPERRRAESPLFDGVEQRFLPLQVDVRGDRINGLLHPVAVIERHFQIQIGQVQHRLHSAVMNGKHGQTGVQRRAA